MLHHHCNGCGTVSDVIPVCPAKEWMSHYLLNMLTYTIVRVTYHPAGGSREGREGGKQGRGGRREEGEGEGGEGGGEGKGGGKGGEMTVVHTHFLVHTVILTMWFGTETGYQMRDKHKLYKHRVKIQDMKVVNKYV